MSACFSLFSERPHFSDVFANVKPSACWLAIIIFINVIFGSWIVFIYTYDDLCSLLITCSYHKIILHTTLWHSNHVYHSFCMRTHTSKLLPTQTHAFNFPFESETGESFASSCLSGAQHKIHWIILCININTVFVSLSLPLLFEFEHACDVIHK